MIDNFRHEYFFLSNFYPCKIYWGGIGFPTVEHAYQAAKTDDDKIIRKISNLHADKAGTAKYIGNQLKLRPHWDDELRLTMMLILLRQKFDQNSLKKKLLDTKGHELVEGNYHHDNFFGICKCKKCSDIMGQNHLGKQLMFLRSKI